MPKNNTNNQIKRPLSYQFLPHPPQTCQRIIFTKQQQQFFASAISMFQVVKKDIASYTSVKNNLKRTRLTNQTIQTIVNNSKLNNLKQGICFQDLKKLLRGVALAQNGIQPTVENISNFSIKSTPIFYQLKQFHNNAQQNNSSDRTETRLNIKQTMKNQYMDKSCLSETPDRSETTNTTITRKVFRPKEIKTKNIQRQFPKQMSTSPSHVTSIQGFQTYWKSVNTVQNKISGVQVKKLCQNESNRQHLSKAWKLCNLACKGYLTKGQFYVFLNLIQSAKNKGQVLEELTVEMQKTISKLDEKTNTKVQQSNLDGGKSLLVTSPFKSPKKQQNLQNQYRQFTQNYKKIKQEKQKSQVNRMNGIFHQRSQKLNHRVQQLLQLKNQSHSSLTCIAQLDKYIEQIDRKNDQIQKQIKILRQNQNLINNRMKSACGSIKKAVQKQQTLITELSQQLQKNRLQNEQNAKNLENIQRIFPQENNIQLEVNSIIKSGRVQFPRKSLRSMQEQIEKFNQQKTSKSFKANRMQNSSENPQIVNQGQKRANTDIRSRNFAKMKQSIQSLTSYYTDQKAQNQLGPKLRTPKQKMSQIIQQDNVLTQKQIKTLQLVNYLAPIQQDQYGVVVQRITSMDQTQLAKLYMKLYQTYLKSENQIPGQFSSQLRSKIQNGNTLTAEKMINQHSLVIQGSSIHIKPQVNNTVTKKNTTTYQQNSLNNSRRKSARRIHTDYQQQQFDTNIYNFINQGDFDEIEDMQIS